MTIYGDNYAFDFYTWGNDIQCAEKVAKEFVEIVMKRKRETNRKALILRAIQTNNYTNYPDSESPSSIDTNEFNEIHTYEIPGKIKKTKWYSCFKLKFSKKIK
jgi:LPS sulfotransferase NodH